MENKKWTKFVDDYPDPFRRIIIDKSSSEKEMIFEETSTYLYNGELYINFKDSNPYFKGYNPNILHERASWRYTHNEYDDLLHAAIKKWGVDAQIRKIQEESLELALAITNLNSSFKDNNLSEENLYSELADMKIMMDQAMVIFNKGTIDQMVEMKMKRLKDNYLPNNKNDEQNS